VSNTLQEFEEVVRNIIMEDVYDAGTYEAEGIDPESAAEAAKLIVEAHNQDREAYAREQVVEELKRLKEFNGSFIGDDGLRKNGWTHHSLIDNRIRELEAPITDKENTNDK
jgi:hypothetical protein